MEKAQRIETPTPHPNWFPEEFDALPIAGGVFAGLDHELRQLPLWDFELLEDIGGGVVAEQFLVVVFDALKAELVGLFL